MQRLKGGMMYLVLQKEGMHLVLQTEMLKLNASYSKKVPADTEYSSQSFHASVEEKSLSYGGTCSFHG